MTNTKQNNSNWVFVPVHKSRIIKELDRAILIKYGIKDNGVSTILPKVFKRVKETETHMFFSLPIDFKINVRVNSYCEETKQYTNEDTLLDLKFVDLKVLSQELKQDE